MKLPDAPWRHWAGLDALLAALGADRGHIRFVGGAVRDTLLRFPVYDLDCATRYEPGTVMERLEAAGIKAVPTGIAHGTVTAVIGDGQPVEVTTLRRDVESHGRHATVAYTDSWEEDAARRDFTFNALSADPATGEVFDYHGGLADLENRHVRFIGDPYERIAEDHLRILRFFRFHARFGAGEPDSAGLAAATERANDLMALSRERIADEMLKTLALPDPRTTIKLMVERGILAPVLPEITKYQWHVMVRLIDRVERLGYGPDAVRRLAALLPADAETARAVAARLKLSRAQRKRLVLAAERAVADAEKPRALAYRLGEESAADRLLLGDATDEAIAGALETLATNPPPAGMPIKGRDLIAMGVEPGPEVSDLLKAIEAQWIAEDFPGEERVREIAADRLGAA